MALKLDRETRRKQIIEISLEIIRQGGIQKLTIKEISKQLGLSEQAIYRHFDDKLEILVLIIQYFNERLRNSFEPTNKAESTLEQIRRLITSHIELLDSYPAMVVVIFGEEIFQNEARLADEVRNALTKRIDHITKLIKRGQVAGEIKNNYSAESLAFMFLGTMRLLATTWRLSSFSFSLAERGKTLINDLIKLIQV